MASAIIMAYTELIMVKISTAQFFLYLKKLPCTAMNFIHQNAIFCNPHHEICYMLELCTTLWCHSRLLYLTSVSIFKFF